MKSVFNKIEKEKSKEIEFPVLAEHTGSGVIVLFIDYSKCIVIHGNKYNCLGEYYESHINIKSESIWRILSPEESIVLSNDWWDTKEELNEE